MIVVHAFLYHHRLKGEDEAARAVGQEVFDLMFRDLDRNLHEMGMSYVAVPKRVKEMGRAFYGRALAYETALQSGEPAELEHALLRNVYGDRPDIAGAEVKLAAYVRAAAGALAGLDRATLTQAGPAYPDPAAFAA
jgi:cytochrome b pre-mRNA-processing protein 3